jgi:iron complex transport system ATP-binding protein
MNVLEIRNLTWTREEKQILSGINWQVKAGENWVILGLNGSGKTSLLKMITGYEWPSRGQVEVLGQAYGQCDIREVRKSIGWVSSSLREEMYKPDRVLDVVISGKYASIGLWQMADRHEREQAGEILERLGCGHLAEERYGTLSQGEKQKVLIARAWMANPKLLILDEPCFGLDISARESLLAEIWKLAAGADSPTILYVTHHVEEILPIFTHVLLLKDGKAVKAGLKQEILTGRNLSETFGMEVVVDWYGGRPWIKLQVQWNSNMRNSRLI